MHGCAQETFDASLRRIAGDELKIDFVVRGTNLMVHGHAVAQRAAKAQ